MPTRPPIACTRRTFLGTASLAALAACQKTIWAGEPPAVKNPRATSGDSVEPDWQQRLTITVGPKKADLVGSDHRVLQAAVEYVAANGGGTVHVLPGTYRLRNAVYLRSKVRLLGSGDDTILCKEPSVSTKLDADSDWFDQEITLAQADGFEVGDGVCLRTHNPHNGGVNVAKRTLVARSGKRFKLDRALRENFWRAGETTVSSLFPILSGELIGDVAVESLLLDGNRAHNDELDGNYAGCIFCQDCNRLAFRQVTACNYHGDGISWQICHDVTVEQCHCHDNTGLGLHPGSGSQRPVIRNNRMHHNNIGLFFCWGVRNGLAENNLIEDNHQTGISIGHHDTENRIVGNMVRRSGRFGVLFRPERGRDFAPHRNQLERNRIEDSGADDGVAIEVQGESEGVVIARNEIVETRGPARRIGIRISEKTHDLQLIENHVHGCAREVVDLRPKVEAKPGRA